MNIHNLDIIGTASGSFTGAFSGSVVGDGSSITNLNYQNLAIPGANGDLLINDNGVIGSTDTLQADNFYVSNALTASIVSASYIELDALTDATAPAYKEGTLFYDSEQGALTFYNNEADVSLQIGQEFWVRVINKSGALISNGTPVYKSGSLGDKPQIFPASAGDVTVVSNFKNTIFGVATHDIEDNTEGYITTSGIVRGVDTTIFASGSTLYVETGSGGSRLRDTPPPFPYQIIEVGLVTTTKNNGNIFVRPKEPVHFGIISGLSGSSDVPDSALWVYDSSSGGWYNSTNVPNITASGSFSGSFYGDGSNLSGVTSYTDSDTLAYINSLGVISGSDQITQLSSVEATGSFTGSFVGDGSGLTGVGGGGDSYWAISGSGNTIEYTGSVKVGGDIIPTVNGTQDLGSSTLRWNVIYTSDLSLKNDIGDWTIVEGEDDLFLYNNKKNKVYKFNLTEVDADSAPKKR